VPVIETVYRRTTQLDWTEVRTCPHCQARWKGGVIARGHGRDETTYGFGAQAAFDNAGIDSFSNAVSAGRVALLRARCPRCHKRGGGVVSLAVKTVLFYALLVVLFTSIARSLSSGGTWVGGSSPLILPLLIALALVLIPLTIVGMLRSVDRRVRFEPLEEIGSQPAPPPVAPRPGPAPVARRPMNAAASAPASAPPPPRAPAAAPAADSDSLELDLDRSWNKKG